jgi:hypothetical protein
MDINEHERLSNSTLRHTVKEQFVARKDMDVNERLPNICYKLFLYCMSKCNVG